MKYVVRVNGRTVEVTIDAAGVRVDDVPVDARLADVEGTPVSMLTIGNEVHRVIVRRGRSRGSYALDIGGFRYDVEALDERTRTIRELTAASATPAGPAPLVAPMPGLIVRVTVSAGDSVRAGQPLVVMEAMKMENELRAPAAGTVRTITAVAGAAVEKGAVLVELDPPAS
ncbi:MAG: biotin/lipoyl-containing protein [Gemmatimonadaceae bacterium]